MSERPDAFEVLRRPITPLAPSSEFAASLRRRVQQELGMTVADDLAVSSVERDGTLAMVHLRVADADRAIAFFGDLLGWEAERVVFEDHVSHYTFNTDVTVRILDDPSVPPVTPNYRVSDVAEAVRSIELSGGRVSDSEVVADGGGWARGADDQGLPFLIYRPHGDYGHIPTRSPMGDVGLVFIRADAQRARRFYGQVLGWRIERVHPDSNYFDTVPRVGIFDEAAAFGTEVTPSVTLYLLVPAIRAAAARVAELGGRAGRIAQDMGPYYTTMCTDDQGTEFGLMSEALD